MENVIVLPSKEAKSLSYLTFSLVSLYLFNEANSFIVKLTDALFSLISFLIATSIVFIKNFDFPLQPCKNRCSESNKFFLCERDLGYLVGVLLSFLIYISVGDYFPAKYKIGYFVIFVTGY